MITGSWANIAGTGAAIVVFDDLRIQFKKPWSVLKTRGGGLKTPTAIDRRPLFLGIWAAVCGNVWGRKRDGMQLGIEREKGVQHSS